MPTPRELLESILSGTCNNTLIELYGQENLDRQRARYTKAIQNFAELYGGNRPISVYSAPGRTELCGNHTDHQNGLVIAAAVTLDTIAVVSQSDTSTIRVTSEGFPGESIIALADLTSNEKDYGNSTALIRGVAAGFKKQNGTVGGFDSFVTSDVLKGSGLSSSAAFEVCIANIINSEFNQAHFTPVQLAQISQFAENVYFGKPSGLMDQLTSSVGSAVFIDLKDPANPVAEKLQLDLEHYGLELVVVDTKGNHAGLTDEYTSIREEMEQAASVFGKKILRQVDSRTFYANMQQVRLNAGDRAFLRAHHFFQECERVQTLAHSIQTQDQQAILATLIESGRSSFMYNQNVYCAAEPNQQELAVALANSERILAGSGAWRIQGGGFAGTIQALVPQSLISSYVDSMETLFGPNSCHRISVRAKGGLRVF